MQHLFQKIREYSFILKQRVGTVIPNKEKVDLYVFYYLLAVKYVREQMELKSSGTRQRNISLESILMARWFIKG